MSLRANELWIWMPSNLSCCNPIGDIGVRTTRCIFVGTKRSEMCIFDERQGQSNRT